MRKKKLIAISSVYQRRRAMKPQRKPKRKERKQFKQLELVDQGADDETECSEVVDGNAAPEHKTTSLQAYITVVRASLGPGCLSLPYAFASAGTVLGPALLTIISIVTLFNVHSLVACRAFLERQHVGARVKTYGDLGYYALGGKYGRAGVEVLLVFMYVQIFVALVAPSLLTLGVQRELGICTVYFEFIATNLAVVLPPMVEDDDPLLESAEGGSAGDRRLLMMLIFPFLTMLAWIRHMKQLAPFSMAANVFMILGIIIVLGFAFHNITERGWAQGLPAWKMDTVPLFYGTVIYSFEGCGAVLPVENSMEDPGGAEYGSMWEEYGRSIWEDCIVRNACERPVFEASHVLDLCSYAQHSSVLSSTGHLAPSMRFLCRLACFVI
jgi:hypothetical protein